MYIKKTTLKGSIDKKICLIADIHFYPRYNLNRFRKVIDTIKSINPDYICIAGDIIDASEYMYLKDMKYLYGFLKELSSIAKVIISLGNHDITCHNDEYLYPDLMIEELKNISNLYLLENKDLIIDDIRFIGYLEDYNILDEVGYEKEIKESLDGLLDGIDDKYYNVLLSHNPLYVLKDEIIDNTKNFDKLNIILSGHTHNGMLPNFLKTNHVLITPMKKFFKKNGRGVIFKKNKAYIINGGIVKLSKEAGVLHLFDFLFTSNIDVIEIKKD